MFFTTRWSAIFWSRIRDSNPPPTAWEAVALPDELTLRLPVYCSKGRRFCQQLFGSNPAGAVDFLLFGQRNGKKMDSPCKIQYNKTQRAFIAIFKIVPIKIAYLRYAVCGCCLCIKNANCYNSCPAIKWLFLPESSLDESPISHDQKHGGGALLPVKTNGPESDAS